MAFALRSESVTNVLTPKSIPPSFPVLVNGSGNAESYNTMMNHWLFFNCIRMCLIFPVISLLYPLRFIQPKGFQYNFPFLIRILRFMLLIFTDCEDQYFFLNFGCPNPRLKKFS